MILALHTAHQATSTTNIFIFFNMDVFLVNPEYNMALHVSDTRGAAFVKATNDYVGRAILVISVKKNRFQRVSFQPFGNGYNVIGVC